MQTSKDDYLTIPPFLRIEVDQRRPGYPYAPECEAEARLFNMGFCCRCKRQQDEDNTCYIQVRTCLFKPGEEGYPQALTFDVEGQPVCTEFINDEAEPYRCSKTADLFS